MKRFLKKKWHRIPVALVSALLVIALVAGGALAALLTETQTITQDINEWDYGTITANDIALPPTHVGETFTYTGQVIVELGPDGAEPAAGTVFKMACDADDLYDSYDSFVVTLTLTSQPEESGWEIGYKLVLGEEYYETGMSLHEAGTYLFDQTIEGTAGSASGAAESTITFTLESR